MLQAKTLSNECIKLRSVTLNENDILDLSTQNKLFSPHYGKCINSTRIKNIILTISKYYINKGYITTKPYLKEQNILDGEIEISVAKGIIKNIVDENNESNLGLKTAFIFQKDEPLNLRDLETSLEMINRVPSVDAKFNIKPGNTQNSSIVEVMMHKSTPYHLQLGVSNESNIATDSPYLTANFSIDNLLNMNDILSFRLNGSSVRQDYQSNSGKELNYSFPIGSYLLEFILYNFEYSQEVIGLNDVYVSSGVTDGSTFRLSKIIYRNQHNKLKVACSLLYKDTRNYFSDALIEVSSYKTTQVQLDLTHTYVASWGQLISIYSLYRGTDLFGARNDAYFDANTKEKLQFTKHTLNTNLYYYFPKDNFQLNSNFYAQYSNDYLYDNNKLRVGSFYTVRGYTASYFGDSGFYVKNDLLKSFSPKIHNKILTSISPFVGLDYGYIKCEEGSLSCGTLVGASVGFKTTSELLNTDLTFSKAIKTVANLKNETLFRYNINLNF